MKFSPQLGTSRGAWTALALAAVASTASAQTYVFVGTSVGGSTDPYYVVDPATGMLPYSGGVTQTDNVTDAVWAHFGNDLDAAEGVEGVFGVADVRTLTVQATLARVQLERCDPLAAEALLRAVPERLGRQHPLVLAAESSLASALIARERLIQAREKFVALTGATSSDVRAVDALLARARG